METHIKVSLSMIELRAKVYSLIKMEARFMKVCSRITSQKVRARSFILMEVFMWASTTMGDEKVKVSSILQVVTHMLDSIERVRSMAMVKKCMQMAVAHWANGLMDRRTGMELLLGQMVVNIVAHSKMISEVVMVKCSGLMVELMLDCGKTANSMTTAVSQRCCQQCMQEFI